MRSCAFVTLGCKINQYETQAVREEVLALGYREVPPEDPADVYVVNTCSVTHESGAKSRRAVLRLARRSPAARIVVMGCSSPEERDLLRRVSQVAVLVGNEEKGMVSTFLEAGVRPGEFTAPARASGRGPRLRVPRRSDPGIARPAMDLEIARFEGRTRAYLKVQDGCSSFCSFCIIPFLRGLSQSRPKRAVLEEARRLVGNGYRELVLTGIHLQDYGQDLEPRSSLLDLLADLARVAEEEGLWRIRLSSIGERSFTPEVVDLFRNPVFCPHWHIPLQSGDDGVLKLMRRDYTRDDFRATVRLLHSSFERPSITTDVIVGHPGETEEAFANTLDLCREAAFPKIHIFPFSPREGTRSAKLPGALAPAEIGRRARELRSLERELALAYKRDFLGETVEVLVEGGSADGPETIEGFTERYLRVRMAAGEPERLRNTLQSGVVEGASAETLEARLLPEGAGSERGGEGGHGLAAR
jgi:threonylcarbamoyladenosine tRNA methylthiotransferase MtaB